MGDERVNGDAARVGPDAAGMQAGRIDAFEEVVVKGAEIDKGTATGPVETLDDGVLAF